MCIKKIQSEDCVVRYNGPSRDVGFSGYHVTPMSVLQVDTDNRQYIFL